MKTLTLLLVTIVFSCAGTRNGQTTEIKVLKTTSQRWAGGAVGSGYGTFYIIEVTYGGQDRFSVDTFWVGARPFVPDVRGDSTGRYTIKAKYSKRPARDPETGVIAPGNYIERPVKSDNPPSYDGAGLLVYRLNGERHVFVIEVWKQLEPLHYP